MRPAPSDPHRQARGRNRRVRRCKRARSRLLPPLPLRLAPHSSHLQHLAGRGRPRSMVWEWKRDRRRPFEMAAARPTTSAPLRPQCAQREAGA
jgi:hypothetical protein